MHQRSKRLARAIRVHQPRESQMREICICNLGRVRRCCEIETYFARLSALSRSVFSSFSAIWRASLASESLGDGEGDRLRTSCRGKISVIEVEQT